MVSEAIPTTPAYTPEVIESSDLEEMNSTGSENLSQADFNNRRLAQALNYLDSEGGKDSTSTFISRVNRINDALLEPLYEQGSAFDTKLYRRVRAMVLDVQRDFESAAHEATPHSESNEDMLEYYTPTTAEEALYRASDSSPSPTPASFRAPSAPRPLAPRRPGSDNVERERVFKYGGPKNDPEIWHKDYPAILPFPETLLMAHWESLKIDYDLSRSKDSSVVETNVPLNHPQLQRYFNLPQYESGSRFRHPAVSKDVQKMVSQYGTTIRLDSVVDAFNKGGIGNDGSEKYCPRAVLEKFTVDKQAPPDVVSPTQLRQALGSTPTKSRFSSTGNTGTVPSHLNSPTLFQNCLDETDNASGPHAIPSSPLTNAGSSYKPRATPTPTRAGAAIRAFEKKVRQSSGSQAAANAEHVVPTKKPSPVRTMTHVEIPKRGRGRPRKNPEIEPVPSSPVKKSLGKRKPSADSQSNTTPESSIRKTIHVTKRQKTTPAKTVGFVETTTALEEESEDPNHPASPVKRPVLPATAGASKASVAGKVGKQARKKRAPKTTEEIVTAEEYERRMVKGKGIVKIAEGVKRGATRSGANFAV
ncbi:hypothetical protein FB567DRAFT_552222 [Paraphoma chrysanthemicola]|uniref:Uncharacterized protein n=1 Tax=Paraphoma chrysanthemicola TaxID=798071 RepID=A0A8K0QXY4_9PLEO|nr:hypothetical protein FB567DRAFT_552222 [Paraphoma chrysanthemicola]